MALRTSLACSLFLLGSFATTACTSDADSRGEAVAEDSDLKGTSGIQPVEPGGANLPANLRAVHEAIAKVQFVTSFDGSEPPHCTGTHVGRGLILTAGHCFRRSYDSGMVARRTPRNEDPGMTRTIVTFPGGDRHDATMLDYELTKAHDYAILRLDDGFVPAAAIPVRRGSEPPYGAALTMLSHPQGQGFVWSPACSYDDPRNMTDTFGMVDVTRDRFAHQCASDPGASGAALIDANAIEVVGIHNGYLEEALYGMTVGSTPLAQYLDGLAEPEASLETAHTGAFENAKVTGTVTAAADEVSEVTFEIARAEDAWELARDPVTVSAAPFTATFDTGTLPTFSYELRATLRAKNGATRVLESTFIWAK